MFLTVRENLAGSLLGYALFLTRKGQTARFYSLIVHPSARGKGVARMLCQNGLERLRQNGEKAVSLEVDVADDRAIGLYESLGFVRRGVWPNYYEDGRSALKMQLVWKA